MPELEAHTPHWVAVDVPATSIYERAGYTASILIQIEV
jgi:hypothetical protein